MGKPNLMLVAPASVIRTVTPSRRPNRDLRTREYLTGDEVERLVKAAKGNRWGHRDAVMLCPQGQAGHALCASDPRRRTPRPAPAPARAEACIALRVHVGARAPFTTAGFARMVERAGTEAKLGFKAHPHMLRHATGLSSLMTATPRGHCKPTSATRTSSTPCATPNYRRRDSRIGVAAGRFFRWVESRNRTCATIMQRTTVD
jgi:hypothetical protein